jgi:hypothetical protein
VTEQSESHGAVEKSLPTERIPPESGFTLMKKVSEIRVHPRPGSHRTSKLTLAPAATFCPTTGTCDTIMLAGDGCTGGPGSAPPA